MYEAIRHYSIVLIGMTLTGLICAAALPFTLSPRGGVGPTIFQAESPVTATMATMLALAVALGVALVVGRLINAAVGLWTMGWGMTVFAMRTETVQELVLAGHHSLLLVAAETLFWAVLVLVMTILMFAVAGRLKDIEPREYEEPPHPIRSPDALKCAAAGLAVVPAVLLIAQSPMKGQVLTAVWIGAVFAGLIGRLISPHVQPILLFATPVAVGALGHVVSRFLLHGTLEEAFVAHSLPALSLPMPIDYAGASMMGVAFGVGWARSFLHHEEEEERHANGEAGHQPARV